MQSTRSIRPPLKRQPPDGLSARRIGGVVLTRFLARQFARPSGWAGRWLVAPILDRTGAAMNRLTFQQLRLEPSDTIVEVGFGGGDLIARLLAANLQQVVGIDLSEDMVARARRRFRRELEEGRLSLFPGSAEKLPLRNRSVDKACSVNNIYFWNDPARVMAEFARVLRPGGKLGVSFQTPEAVRNWPGHIHGFTAYEPEEVARLMEQAGFVGSRTAKGNDSRVGDFICMLSERA